MADQQGGGQQASPDQQVPMGPFEDPIPIENQDQVALIVVSTLAIFVPSVFIALRLYAKSITSRSVDMSDACIVIALLFNWGLSLDQLLMCLKGGFGHHLQEVIMRFGPDTATFFFKAILAFCILWNVTICFSKLSVLFLYQNLMPMRSMIIPARCLGAFIIVWNVSNIIAQLCLCQPFARNWDQTLDGHCGSQPDFYFAMGIINILTDVVMLALPMPFLYKLNLPTRKKIALIGMFAIGIMTTAVSIYRQVTLPGMNFADMTKEGVRATIFSALEPPVAISLACVPYLRTILGGRWAANSPKYGMSGSSTNGFSRSGNRLAGSQPLASCDDSSEMHLQPMHGVGVEGAPPTRGDGLSKKGDIRVETTWEVTSNTSNVSTPR